MFRDKILYVVVALVLAILAALTVRAELATSAIAVGGQDNSDYGLRHPNLAVPAGAPGASDWFERHPDSLNAANAVDLSDYAQRHPEVLKSAGPASMDDWFQRHPEMLKSTGAAGVEDWFQRHPDSIQGKSPASSIDALNSARWDAINAAYQQRYQGLFGQAAVDRAASLRSQELNERYGLSR